MCRDHKSFPVNRFIAFTAYSILLVFSLSFYSCTKDKINAPGATIMETVSALKAENPDCTCEPYMNQYMWRDHIVYVLAYKGPLCNTFPSYYNKAGVQFNMAAGYTLDSFLAESHFLKNIWTCKE